MFYVMKKRATYI